MWGCIWYPVKRVVLLFCFSCWVVGDHYLLLFDLFSTNNSRLSFCCSYSYSSSYSSSSSPYYYYFYAHLKPELPFWILCLIIVLINGPSVWPLEMVQIDLNNLLHIIFNENDEVWFQVLRERVCVLCCSVVILFGWIHCSSENSPSSDIYF